jgi:hypothetical protein
MIVTGSWTTVWIVSVPPPAAKGNNPVFVEVGEIVRPKNRAKRSVTAKTTIVTVRSTKDSSFVPMVNVLSCVEPNDARSTVAAMSAPVDFVVIRKQKSVFSSPVRKTTPARLEKSVRMSRAKWSAKTSAKTYSALLEKPADSPGPASIVTKTPALQKLYAKKVVVFQTSVTTRCAVRISSVGMEGAFLPVRE